MENQLRQFLDEKYVSLETYKKDGHYVRTPLWFVIYNDLIYVITLEATGKVKRIKNNNTVRIAPCSFKGEPKKIWIKGKVEKIIGDEANEVIKLRMNKYGRSAKLVDQIRKGNFAVFAMKSVIESEPVVVKTGPETTLWKYRWHHSTINYFLWLTVQNGLKNSAAISLANIHF